MDSRSRSRSRASRADLPHAPFPSIADNAQPRTTWRPVRRAHPPRTASASPSRWPRARLTTTPIAPPPRTSRRMSRHAPGTPSPSPRAAPGGSRTPSRRSARASFLRAEARERDGCSAPSLPFRTPSRRCERWRTSTSPGQSPASSTPSRTSPPPTSSWTTPWRCSAGSATGRARAAPCTRRRLRTTRATRAWRRRRSRRMPPWRRATRRRRRATGSTTASARWRPRRAPGPASAASARSRLFPTRSWSSCGRRAGRS